MVIVIFLELREGSLFNFGESDKNIESVALYILMLTFAASELPEH